MFNTIRSLRALGRVVNNRNVQLQTRRTIYPFYLRYMIAAGKPTTSNAEQAFIYMCFLIGILGPPTFIMYDVGKKRPDSLHK